MFQLVLRSPRCAVLVLDAELAIVEWSHGAEQVLGWDRAEAVGKRVLDFVASDAGRTHAATHLQRALAGERVDTFLFDGRTREGGSRRIVWSAHRIEDDRLAGLVLFGHDVAPHLDAEEALRQSEGRMAALVEATQDAVVAIDSDARITLFNRAAERIFGWARDEILGQKVDVLMSEPYASEHDRYIRAYEEGGPARAIGRVRTVSAQRKNGEAFPIELSVAEYRIDDERRYAAVIRDISEKRRLQDERVEREKLAAIGTTAAKFAHEIGNPINGMSVNGQLLQRFIVRNPGSIDPWVADRIELIMNGIARLGGLLDEFRSLSRRQKFEFVATDLGALVEHVLEGERASYEHRGVVVELAIEPDVPLVLADAEKLAQVVLNLGKNAVEAMPDGGPLRIRVAPCRLGVAVEVEDAGVGIPDGLDVFEPFSSSKPEGTGLGLPIVRQIVEAHQGRITYRSTPGVGTTFRVELPA